MRSPLVLAVFALPLATLASTRPSVDRRAAEVHRIRAHFDSVLVELPAHDATRLTAAQRARRSTAMATLRAYRDRGDFPHNYDFPGRAVPYFVDRETGTLCAVAHLLAASGRRDIVDRVARADNNVWVATLAADTAFTGWLATSGLTLNEAARIQVPYESAAPPLSAAGIARDPGYAAGSVIAIGSALTTSILNARTNAWGSRRTRSIVGMATGAFAMGLGAASIGFDRASPVLGATNVAVGAVSMLISTRGMVRHHRIVAMRERETSLVRRAVVAPIVPTSKQTGTGVAVTVPF